MDANKISRLQSKLALQRNEIARLNKVVESLMRDNKSILKDLKWIRGEKDDTGS
tara:strand:+ start:98 stop:259 length:162 start_codon:yes stop_codon:yes gene_type:complete